jgi:hypothetical protein
MGYRPEGTLLQSDDLPEHAQEIHELKMVQEIHRQTEKNIFGCGIVN